MGDKNLENNRRPCKEWWPRVFVKPPAGLI